MTSNNTPIATTVEIGEEEFDDTYKPIPGPGGSDWRDHHEIPEGTPVENVWTVVDADANQYILTGYHTVNYVARIVTQVPWTDENLQVRIDSFGWSDGESEHMWEAMDKPQVRVDRMTWKPLDTTIEGPYRICNRCEQIEGKDNALVHAGNGDCDFWADSEEEVPTVDVFLPVTDDCKNCETAIFKSGADMRWYHEGNHASLCDLSNEEGTHAEPKNH